MNKYAFICTADARMLPGVNAMLNAMKYYGDDDIEFHLLYWPSHLTEDYVNMIDKSGHFPNFRAIDVTTMIMPYDHGMKAVYYLKFYRTLYASQLTDYDAVAFFDADRFITDTIKEYFDIAVESGKILMPDYRFRREHIYDGFYDQYPIQGTNGCPFDPSATFFVPSIWGKYFETIHRLGRNIVKRSEMPTVNYMLITDKLLEEVIGLPTRLFNLRKWHSFHIDWGKDESGKYAMQVYETNERMVTIHGRWWFTGTLVKKAAKEETLKKKPVLAVHNHAMNQIIKVMDYFNFECWTQIDWQEEWFRRGAYIAKDGSLQYGRIY